MQHDSSYHDQFLKSNENISPTSYLKTLESE